MSSVLIHVLIERRLESILNFQSWRLTKNKVKHRAGGEEVPFPLGFSLPTEHSATDHASRLPDPGSNVAVAPPL